MADTTTTNLLLTKPEVGASQLTPGEQKSIQTWTVLMLSLRLLAQAHQLA
jgi:hypothetical protein